MENKAIVLWWEQATNRIGVAKVQKYCAAVGDIVVVDGNFCMAVAVDDSAEYHGEEIDMLIKAFGTIGEVTAVYSKTWEKGEEDG